MFLKEDVWSISWACKPVWQSNRQASEIREIFKIAFVVPTNREGKQFEKEAI